MVSIESATTPQYMVSVYEPDDSSGRLIYTFVPTASVRSGAAGSPNRPPQFIVAVPQDVNSLAFDWSRTPDQPGTAQERIEADVRDRLKIRALWIERVNLLVSQLETWAGEIGWSTRRVEKKLDDTLIGKHRLPALLMQEGVCKIFLEPVGRSTPGAEGVVDLYLMPAYDDIASLYYYQDRWNLHFMFRGTQSVATIREAASTALSKESFEKVLVEMRQNAA